jgi:hypothetical protein
MEPSLRWCAVSVVCVRARLLDGLTVRPDNVGAAIVALGDLVVPAADAPLVDVAIRQLRRYQD